MGVTMLDINELLDKNPEAKEVFEKNEAKLAEIKPTKKSEYRIGLPYGTRRPVADSINVDPIPPVRHVKMV